MRPITIASQLPSDEELDLLLRQGLVDLCDQPLASPVGVRLRTRLLQRCRSAERDQAIGAVDERRPAPLAPALLTLELLRPFALRTMTI